MTRREFAEHLFKALTTSKQGAGLPHDSLGNLRVGTESGSLDHNESVTGPTAASRIDLEMLDGSTVEIMVRKFP